MLLKYSQIDLNSYVAKYIDENGCNLEEACKELDIDIKNIFQYDKKQDY